MERYYFLSSKKIWGGETISERNFLANPMLFKMA
jgi:hypothetical protein